VGILPSYILISNTLPVEKKNNFKHHIQIIQNKISKMLYFFGQAKHNLTLKAKKSLYYATIHFHLIFWHSYLELHDRVKFKITVCKAKDGSAYSL
jgi:hypothetical protein